MSKALTKYQADNLEDIVRDLILKGKRKRKPFKSQDLDNAVAHGVGLINHLLNMHYPEGNE